jgi:uracil-DNA glycosylase family 4
MFDDELIEKINHHSKSWSLEFTDKVLNFLRSKSFYLTNIVKWTGHDAALPNSEKIKLFLPILEKEIEIVQPQYILAFGLIPFENLTKRKIKLKNYYSDVMLDQKLKFFDMKYGDLRTKIVPCYFPIGRGNPKKSVDILKLMAHLRTSAK